MRDPYELLGVRKDADADAIKAAYRKLAKQLHPDMNPGDAAIESRFKEVTGAYELLSDPKKRQRFDRGEIDASGAERPSSRFYRAYAERNAARGAGPGAGAGAWSGFENVDTEDLFDIFTQGRRGAGARRRGVDVSYSLSVDFVAAAAGSRRRLNLPDNRALEVQIPPGTSEGTVLRLRGQGQPGANNGPAGDAYIEIQIEPHPFFERRGSDVHLDVPITLQEAVLGATITVPTIDGPVAVKAPKGANTGTVLRLKGRGVQIKAGTRGDQYVKLIVMLPERPDPDLAEFIQRWGPAHPYAVRSKLGVDG